MIRLIKITTKYEMHIYDRKATKLLESGTMILKIIQK